MAAQKDRKAVNQANLEVCKPVETSLDADKQPEVHTIEVSDAVNCDSCEPFA